MRTASPFGPWRGLSGRVLALTVLFVMLGEVLIFLPSIANFRIQWMKARIAQAEIAALAAEAAPGQMLNAELRTEILKGVGVTAVSLQKKDLRQLVLRNSETVDIAQGYDLRSGMYYATIGEALKLLGRSDDRVISVRDFPPNMSGELIDVSLHEKPLRDAMLRFGLNILGLSVALSLIVAAMIFAALDRLLVRPMQTLAQNMFAFAARPADVARVIRPTGRTDEIGIMQNELQSMQTQIQSMLQQREHLAALGLAVAKVSHDLRNMLTSAQLLSDRLSQVNDPNVQRFAPKLFASLDRAIHFLNETIRYGKAQELPPRKERLQLAGFVRNIADEMHLSTQNHLRIHVEIADTVSIDADREHLARIFTNLIRNAAAAVKSGEGQGFLSVTARQDSESTTIHVDDNGPGIPPAIRDRLFEPFQSADGQGGTGLGLAIVAELVRAHGGTITMPHTGATGTSFVISLPHTEMFSSPKIVALPRSGSSKP
jgi:signal transduction histidine kinase